MAEIFGHLVTDFSAKASRFRAKRLCPFNNKVPNCTKDKAKNPLGVCSIYFETQAVITCPIRFREDWLITEDAASFFFGEGVTWRRLTEVRLKDSRGGSAGNIDVVLAAHDEKGRVYDFGALEVQAVYISGNVREPFTYYMKDPQRHAAMDWTDQPGYPRPDYLSSSRKRWAPQLLFKGGILNMWGKRMAVALSKGFFETLPPIARVQKAQADIAWFVYDLEPRRGKEHGDRLSLVKVDEVFTGFQPALASITTSSAGAVSDFITQLQGKLDGQIEASPKNTTIEGPS
ncbi:MAG: NotI family restriction endonuclease [Candidatus Eisenbacteria bacterium]